MRNQKSSQTESVRRDSFRPSFGFTVIELLVVIAVIAVLASLLLPSLTGAKRAAENVQCKSNLHQILLGLQMYVDDVKSYPHWSSVNNPNLAPTRTPDDPTVWWFDAIEPYTRSRWTDGLYRCPAYTGVTADFDRYSNLTASGSYGYNWIGCKPFDMRPLGSPPLGLGPIQLPRVHVTESMVMAPSDMIAIGDANLFWSGPKSSTPLPPPYDSQVRSAVELDVVVAHSLLLRLYSGQDYSAIAKANQRRHGGRYNVAFCDGHVTMEKPERLFENSESSMRHWNIDHEAHLEDTVGW